MKKKILIIGALILLIIGGVFLAKSSFKPEPLELQVEGFINALIEDNYELAYDYLDVPNDILKSETALDDVLSEIGLNINNISKFSTKLIRDKNTDKTSVKVTINDRANNKSEVLLDIDNDGIKVPYVENYKITVPSGTTVQINELEIDSSIATKSKNIREVSFQREVDKVMKEETIEIPISLDNYIISSLLDTSHILRVNNPQGIDEEEHISDFTKPYTIYDLTASEELIDNFRVATELFMNTLIDCAVNQKDFSEIEKLIYPESDNIEILNKAYLELKDIFKGKAVNDVKFTFENYKLTDIIMNDVYIIDDNKARALIQYNLEYEECKTIGTAKISNGKKAQKVGIITFKIVEDDKLLLDNSQGIFTLHQ